MASTTAALSGLKPEQIVQRLVERKIVASATPYATSYGRLAPGLLNNPEQSERVLAEVQAFAQSRSRSPETQF